MSSFSCYLVGSDTLLLECAAILREEGHELRGVVTSEERVHSWCRERHVPVVDASADWGASLREAGPFDVLFSVAHPSIIPAEILELPRRLAVNFHDGPLPGYAGLNAPVWALLNQEEEYGITWHVMTPGVDEGPILSQVRFPLASGETAQSLNTRCLAEAVASFPGLVRALAEGRGEPAAQDLTQRTVFRRFDRPPSACLVDWSSPSEGIDAFVRGLSFGPHPNPVGLPKTQVHGHEPFVVASVAVSGESGRTGAPGEVLWVREGRVGVATGDGVVNITSARGLNGSSLSVSVLQTRYGVRVGARMVDLDSPLARRLSECDASWAPREPGWARRLSMVEPPELPVGAPGRPGSGRDTVVVPLDDPTALSPDPVELDHAWLATAVAVTLARLGERDRIDLALPASASADVPGSFYLPWVPTPIFLDPKGSVTDVVSQIRRAEEENRALGSVLRDLPLRTPGLAERTAPWPVAVGEGDATGHGAPRVVFRLAPKGAGVEATFLRGPLAAEDAATLTRAVVHCLEAALARPGEPWVRMPLTDEGEDGATHLRELNSTRVEHDRQDTVPRQLLRQALRTPDRTAVFFEGRELSYRELMARAAAVAGALRERGVEPGDVVGIHVDRSLELPVAIVGVLLSGAAYLPLDPDLPRKRLSFMLEDAGAVQVLTRGPLGHRLPDAVRGRTVVMEELALELDGFPPDPGPSAAEDLAYAIYTSGSTGTPKGVLVEHRNVVNFFTGMDRVVPAPRDHAGVWLAVTRLSFDISVLELLWTLSRGFEVVIHRDRSREGASAGGRTYPDRPMAFGLFMWGNDDGPGPGKYRLMLEGARYFDRNGFDSVWTPERHFHAFGGPFPNPAVTGAALAATTERLRIRSGSCVAPLHHPIRIAEEWGVVDNLSDGRVDLAFAAGWQPNDFILRPESHGAPKEVMVDQIETVRRLWRGESVEFENPLGERVPVTTLPRPVQPELPVWVTTAGDVDTYRLAGSMGANLLTHLLGQSLEEVGERIAAYREARSDAGFDPDEGIVTLMLHTFVGDSDEEVRQRVREPMKDFLRSSIESILGFAWSFPAFKRPGGSGADSPGDVDLESLREDEIEAILDFAFDRYFEARGLFGTPSTCAAMVDRCKGAGVDEIACLLDFGVNTDTVLESLPLLRQVRDEANAEVGESLPPDESPLSFADLVRDRGVTHLQCTPSMARMVLQDPASGDALRRIPHLLVGGEVFPESLAAELLGSSAETVTNLYGPTETTIWSLAHRLSEPGPVPIGRPLANTRIHVLDRFGRPVPAGVPGHLWIAGEGVGRGYLGRPELTAKRFVADLYDPHGGLMYRTGDRVRIGHDGTVEFLGRVDHQVKVRGHRIELGEIEAALEGLPGVAAAAAVLRAEDGIDPCIEAFVVGESSPPAEAQLKTRLRAILPDSMVPSRIVSLEELPLTPNGKVDRKALPAAGESLDPTGPFAGPESELEERIASCWRTTLARERVGVDDDFFDIGGHSLLVVRLHRELQKVLDPAPTLAELYRFPTVRALSHHLAARADSRNLLEGRERAGQRRRDRARRRQRTP